MNQVVQKFMKLSTILGICFLVYVCCCATKFASAQDDPVPVYEMVSDYLNANRRAGSSRIDLQNVVAYLKSETDKGPFGNTRVITFLRHLANLAQSASPHMDLDVRCSNIAYESVTEMLKQLDENMLPDGKSRLLDRMIYKLAIKRAQDCQRFFLVTYDTTIVFMNPEKTRKLRFIMSRLIAHRLPGVELSPRVLEGNAELQKIASQALYSTFVLGTQTVGGPVDAEIVYTAFGDMARSLLGEGNKCDQNGKLKAAHVEDYYENNLWELCTENWTRFGRYLFKQARSGALFLPQQLGPEVSTNVDYYFAWAQTRLCQGIAESPQTLGSDLTRYYVWPAWQASTDVASTSG